MAGNLHAIDVEKGRQNWQFKATGNIHSTPALSGQKVLFGCDSGKVYAVDCNSGKGLWETSAGAEVWTSPVVRNGVAFFGSADACVYAVDVGKGAKRWTAELGGRVYSTACVGDRHLYVGCGDGLEDPNFSQFLGWSERLFAESQVRRYRLVRESEVETAAKMHGTRQRVQVLSYGKRFGDLIDFIKNLSLRQGQRMSARAVPTSRTLLPNISPAPRFELRGIDWYEEQDAAYLHGRTSDVQHLKQLLAVHPVVRLAGPSGTGKSSLLRAGLIPELRKLGWRSIVIRPYDDPNSTVAGELSRAVLAPSSEPFVNPITHHALREQLLPLLTAEGCQCLVILIDQVEDVLAPSAAARERGLR